MKIALIGYGRMGREIEQAALDRGHEIGLIIDNEQDWDEKYALMEQCDVAIDFSLPESVIENIFRCFDKNVPVVVGTTAWHDRLEELKIKCFGQGQTLFVASNFSIGVNIFFELNKRLADMMDQYAEYEPQITETHHIHKQDAPSGTAIKLADDMISRLKRKNTWQKEKPDNTSQLAIKSTRENEVPGIHEVVYESQVDKIELRHEAKSRKGFAKGAVVAAEWVNNKKGFYEMNDMLFAR